MFLQEWIDAENWYSGYYDDCIFQNLSQINLIASVRKARCHTVC